MKCTGRKAAGRLSPVRAPAESCLSCRPPQQMAYPAQVQLQQPMQAPAPAYQQVLPRAAVQQQMQAPPRTAQLSAVGNVATERAEAQRTSFQVCHGHSAHPFRYVHVHDMRWTYVHV